MTECTGAEADLIRVTLEGLAVYTVGVAHLPITAGILLFVGSFAALTPGCASAPPADDTAALQHAPTDFTLAFTIVNPTPKRNVNTMPRETRPTRFVIETDWVLRGFVGAALIDQGFPRETRQLDEREIDGIWADLRDGGLLEPDHAAIVGTPPTLASVNELTWIITLHAHGDRRMLMLRGNEQEAAKPLMNRLADLAWMAK